MLDVAHADAAFGTDLYRQLAGPGNLVLSPASIATALRMALIGARGQTAAEMATALHLTTAPHVTGPEAAAEAQRELPAIPSGEGLTLRSVNTAWLDSGFSVRDEYLRQPVTVERVPFGHEPEKARRTINSAVEQQTAGKIKDLIGAGLITELTRLVLVNAIYLKARWEHEFPKGQTRKESFYPQGAGPVPVDMMHMDERLAYYRGDGYQAVLLPYKNGPLAMAIVLPDGPLSQFPADSLGGLSGVLGGLLDRPQEYQVDLRLPRFTITAACLLKDTLEALGIRLAFSDDADFSGITGTEPLQVSEVVHQAFIDVDEEGTEAAAATAVVIRTLGLVHRPPAKRVVFTADRPFLFAVVQAQSGLPLFLGQFTRPLVLLAWLNRQSTRNRHSARNRHSGMSPSSAAGRPGCRPRTRPLPPGRGRSSWSGPSIPATRRVAAG
jgi:serpin B